MPSQTSRGYPYPLGTDRVMDGDDSIHALAQAVEDKLGGPHASGTVAIPTLAAAAASSVAVTLPAGRFTAAPIVLSNAGNSRVCTAPGSVTATGFVLGMMNQSAGQAGAHTGYWLALATV